MSECPIRYFATFIRDTFDLQVCTIGMAQAERNEVGSDQANLDLVAVYLCTHRDVHITHDIFPCLAATAFRVAPSG